MSKQILTIAALALAVPALAACGGGAPAAQQTGVPGVSVDDAHMVLNAVPGNPAAIYFDLSYDGDSPTALSRAEVQGADKVELQEYGEFNGKQQMVDAGRISLRKGDTVKFEPGGKHVMVMDPPADLKPGDSTQMTLHFAGGDQQVVPVKVQAAGEDR